MGILFLWPFFPRGKIWLCGPVCPQASCFCLLDAGMTSGTWLRLSFLSKDACFYIECTHHILFNHSSGDPWMVSTLWLLRIMLLWTCLYKHLPAILLSFVLCACPEGRFLTTCLTSWATTIPFPTATHHFIVPLSEFMPPISPHLHQHLQFPTVALWLGMKLYLTVV